MASLPASHAFRRARWATLAGRLAAVATALSAAPAALAQVAVKGDWVSLGDVAPVTGEAANLLVAQSPPPGETLALDPKFVVEAARRSGVSLSLPLDQPILVRRAGVEGTPSVHRNAPTPPPALRVSAAPSSPIAAPAPSTPIPASEAGRSRLPDGWILVVAHDVPRAAKLALDDLEWAPPPTGGVRVRSAPFSAESLVGQETRRPLYAGEALLPTDLKPATVIRRGEPVRLVYAAEGLRLTVEGLAQADASVGQSIRVLNRISKRTIDAVATADGEARVSR